LNRLIRCVCGKKIGPDPRNFNQRVSLGRNDLLIRTFPSGWSGSLADILEVRSEAFAVLLNHVSPEVREMAKTKLSLLNRSIRENREREAEEYNRREQRFE
ncbi:hypothetical protein AB9B33_25035, partial [Klebsiella pneumoniae]|nr:hypothetical protein [Klebsiella pneumoniae]